MEARKKALWSWAAEVASTVAADAAAMALVYLLSYALRTDFDSPACGWRKVAISAAVAVAMQFAALSLAGVYRRSWSRFALADGLKMVFALFAVSVLFVLMRGFLPEFHGARPPYSVTAINFLLASSSLVAMRVLYRAFSESYRSRKSILGRESVLESDPKAIEMLHGKCVMVTGAGGSIGSELSRQIYLAGPRRLVLLERGENALYEINRRLRALGGETELVPQMTDVCNRERMEQIFRDAKPDVVIHAAAYKHVPMVEGNPKEGIRNNFLATVDLGRMAKAHGTGRFVFISTDKAVRPKSVMGITKRLAERALVGLNGGGTVFCAVRFGNVLGSSGSAIPLFEEQVREGRPVTVTHPDMRRYFMTVGEAVSLVLKAAAMAKSGEVFVLDMGEPFNMVDIAEAVIRKAGYRPYVDVPIVFTGIRPGEKLFEELDVGEGSALKTQLNKIYVCRENPAAEGELESVEKTVRSLAAGGEPDGFVRERLVSLARTLRLALLASAGVFFAASSAIGGTKAFISADWDSAAGPVKPVNGVGQPPMLGALSPYNWSMIRYLKEAGIPYSRLHDVGGWLGGGLYVDIPNLFPDFDADENDASNYVFAYTDALLKSLQENDVEPYFRLGVTIENFSGIGYPPLRTVPPKDFSKWARICEHVIRHYTEGWADGFGMKISYWEIWNEPDNFESVEANCMWKAPFSEYIRFYGVVAPYLKGKFPHLKIGGYGSCGFYAGVGSGEVAAANSSPRHDYFLKCADEFLSAARENSWPLDFFSFHSYSSPREALRQVAFAREFLDRHGFGNTETSFNEWLPLPWHGLLGSARQAAMVAAELIGLQNGPCDTAMIYDARCGVGDYSPLFNPMTYKPHRAYYSFLAFNSLRKLGTAVECVSSDPDIFAAAAKGSAGRAVMLSNYSGRTVPFSVEGMDGAKFSAVDADHETLAEINPVSEIRPDTVLLLELSAPRAE